MYHLYSRISGSPILMLLLHVLVGTPQGLNLRNLVWHGFPRPGEISPVLASSMIILMFSLGESLIRQDFTRIKTRPTLNLLGHRGFMAKVERVYSHIPETTDQLDAKFLDFIHQEDVKGPVLQRVFKLLSKNKFRESLILLIPEWECQARLLFTVVNTCPMRSMTAENDKLYTTFDEILSKVRIDVEDIEQEVENLFPVTIGDQHMEYLLDLLVLPEGPRLRDKISHGEIDIKDELCSSVFRMCIYIIIASYNDLSQYLTLADQIHPNLTDYHALFHPKRLLLDEIDDATIAIHSLNEHPSLYNTSDLGPEDPLTKLRPKVQKSFEFLTKQNYIHYIDDHQALRRFCGQVQVRTLYRPKYEYVITGLFRRLLIQMKVTLERCLENLDDKMIKYEADELTSRQLATYARMLETVPRICLLFQIWLLMVILNMENFEDRTEVFKMFKKVLKYAENLAHHTHLSKNRWEESEAIVSKAANLIFEKDFLGREVSEKSQHVEENTKSAVIQELPKLNEMINTN